MSQIKRQKRRSPSPDSSETEDSSSPSPPRSSPSPPWSSSGLCRLLFAERLDTAGYWEPLRTEVRLLGGHLQKWGLLPWPSLDPEVQSRLSSWSPVAKQLWESDFLGHQKAMVQAWIWHYLDDYVFSFAGNQQDGILKLRSPVWEHVQVLRRDLDVLRARDATIHDVVYRHQFQVWNRLTEHLVRGGLEDRESFDQAELVAHFKRSIGRLTILRDKTPDDASDGDHCDAGDASSAVDHFDAAIEGLLKSACHAQYFIHGMDWGYTLRFTPIGPHAGKMFDFPYNPGWMELNNPVEVPSKHPNEVDHPPVQLVSQPMLVASGLKGAKHNTTFTLRTSMCVVTPWTFGGKEARPYVYYGFEKGWELVPFDVRSENQRKYHERKRMEEQQKSQPLVEGLKDGESQATDGHAIDDSVADAPCK
ncbi:predicted protein [Chaetomium globosum CBS 148.51]|uniref:Uncharacterized protein n=1 Tax=Chaetomium globosum (strain ATCC 6205 / CBS 148.51 / DSM 1962 / NBRC 6347 / NRRL 1970) TaxID=306901 RepID=Q2H7H7_CHAGB|nr:uncharacterized protein CHGG_05388 [Chaetomium globosum CBS 148.51]EAQ88769.1 predicted protein [Chaetomium globosum CBS 148.51]